MAQMIGDEKLIPDRCACWTMERDFTKTVRAEADIPKDVYSGIDALTSFPFQSTHMALLR